jgi:hypothetical protein
VVVGDTGSCSCLRQWGSGRRLHACASHPCRYRYIDARGTASSHNRPESRRTVKSRLFPDRRATGDGWEPRPPVSLLGTAQYVALPSTELWCDIRLTSFPKGLSPESLYAMARHMLYLLHHQREAGTTRVQDHGTGDAKTAARAGQFSKFTPRRGFNYGSPNSTPRMVPPPCLISQAPKSSSVRLAVLP